ncbi:hypothetical protein [Nevskia sp.]|uniref:hypothetical protein n=1 Tax=Nevskia sp. TaxID=1929292 RepID=UPI0025F5FA6D|nr:hypothetical protein [Nevskia sp.]
MATPNVQTLTGNRIVVEIDGQFVGLLQSCRGSDDYGLQPVSGIGDIHAQEYTPGMARHTLSVSGMTLIRANLRRLGLFTEDGDGALRGLVFDIVYYSKDTNEALRTYRKCSFASGDIDVSKHAIVMQSGTFMALDVAGTGL